jgi:O-antigen/teichoic acid export membrane protein
MKQTLKGFLPTNRFARSVSILAGGTVAGQGIVVLSSPLLTRLYSPEDFGLLAVYASLLSIVGVVASLRYQLAIPLPEKDEEAANVVVLSLLVVLVVTLLTAVIVFFWGHSIAALANTPALADYMWLLPVGLLIMGIYQVFNNWAIRTKSFTAIARTKLTQSASMVAIQISGYALGPLALLVGRVFGQAAGTSSLGLLAVRSKWCAFRSVDMKGVLHAAGRYRRFPIFSTWGGAFNTAGTQLPPLLFAALFSSSAAGIYMLAHRVLAMPMTLIGKAIADVFFSQAAEARRNGQLGPLVAVIHEKLAYIAMPPALILIFAAPELFAFMFGKNWEQAGVFAQWMAPFLYFNFVASPLSTLNSVMEKQPHALSFQAMLLISRVGAIMLGSLSGSVVLAVALFSLASALAWSLWLHWLIILSGGSLFHIYKILGQALISAIIIIAPLIVVLLSFGKQSCYWMIAIAFSLGLMFLRYLLLYLLPQRPARNN